MTNDSNGKIGVITEQGDLGLGYTQLNEADETAYNNAPSKKDNEKKDDKVVNRY